MQRKADLSLSCAAVVLAAGKGTRMRSSWPKVMHAVAGKSMIGHSLSVIASLTPQKVVTVIAPGMDAVQAEAKRWLPETSFAVQDVQAGTGHAVACAKDALAGFSGAVLIAYGDTPLIRQETLAGLLAALEQQAGNAVAVLGFDAKNPAGYGRLITHEGGRLERIIECKDANAQEKAVTLCNSGVMAVRSEHLFTLLSQVKNHNQSGEYYLTDIVALAREQGLQAVVALADEEEVMGVNSRAELARAEFIMQSRLRQHAMQQGATLIDPASTFLAMDTQLGRDVIIQPQVFFGAGVVVGDGVEIRAFSHIEGTQIDAGAIIGPFARLRPGSVVGEGAHIGNFVELKQTQLAPGAKVNHLSYVGDAQIGEKANIGAGTITCNYDGFHKHRTTIGAGAFIGSNSSLVAPVTIGAGAIVGAGSVITEDVPANALAVERSQQISKEGAAQRVRERKQKP